MTAAASAQHTAANCANVKKRKLEDTAASGPAAKRATRRAAPSGPAASGPGASGPAANSSVSSGPRASGPAASGPAASSPAASGPAAKRATRKAAASGPVASGPAASGTAANSAARRAANQTCKRKREEESYCIPTELVLSKRSRPTKSASQRGNACRCSGSNLGSQKQQKENEDELMSDGDTMPTEMNASVSYTRAAKRRQAARKRNRPGRKPWY